MNNDLDDLRNELVNGCDTKEVMDLLQHTEQLNTEHEIMSYAWSVWHKNKDPRALSIIHLNWAIRRALLHDRFPLSIVRDMNDTYITFDP